MNVGHGEAFMGAAASGHKSVLAYLWTEMNGEQRAFFLETLLTPCLARAAANGRGDVIDFLLEVTEGQGQRVYAQRAIVANDAEAFLSALHHAQQHPDTTTGTNGINGHLGLMLERLTEEQRQLLLDKIPKETQPLLLRLLPPQSKNNESNEKNDEFIPTNLLLLPV